MKGIIKYSIYTFIGICIPLATLGILYWSHLSVPLCDDLYSDFSCQNKDDKKCYNNYDCTLTTIPKTDVKCTYGGFIYYPGDKYCPTEYIFPYWVLILCIMLIIIVILLYIWFVHRYKCWQYMSDPWDSINSGIQTKCKNCKNMCDLVHRSSCCGLCMGFGKISKISMQIKDSIDFFDENIKMNDICTKCNGKGLVPTYEPYCENCNVPYTSFYLPSVDIEHQPLIDIEE